MQFLHALYAFLKHYWSKVERHFNVKVNNDFVQLHLIKMELLIVKMGRVQIE